MLPVWNSNDFADHFLDLGLAPGCDVVVHSKLISFAFRDSPTVVFDALREVLGVRSTIVVPTYTLNLDSNTSYDRRHTPGSNVGVLSEYVRTRPDAIRSRTPLHSHAAVGPKAKLLEDSPITSSMGEGSDFDVLHKEGFRLLLLGCSVNEGCTFLHHCEVLAGVPYRYWIVLQRKIVDEKERERVVGVDYFARRESQLRNDFASVTAAAKEAGDLRTRPAPLGQSHAISLDLLACHADRILSQDPCALLAKENQTSVTA